MASTQTQTRNPNSGSNPQMEQEEEDLRNWAELNGDLLMVIFGMVGIIDVLKSAGAVCRPWRKVAKDEPELWRRIDMTDPKYVNDVVILTDLTRMAIDRSGDRLEEFSIQYFGDDDLLQYLSCRTNVLKSLRLISCYEMSDEEVVNTVKKQPLLEELQIAFGKFSAKLPELIGEEVPNLKHFKWNDPWIHHGKPVDSEDAFGIAKTMNQLRSLQLIGNKLTNKGLKAILEGCPHLESLDIRRCHNVNMDPDMRARCARLTTLRLPCDSLDDYEFEPDAIPDSSDDDQFCYDEFDVLGDRSDDSENIPFYYDGFQVDYADLPWADSDDDVDADFGIFF